MRDPQAMSCTSVRSINRNCVKQLPVGNLKCVASPTPFKEGWVCSHFLLCSWNQFRSCGLCKEWCSTDVQTEQRHNLLTMGYPLVCSVVSTAQIVLQYGNVTVNIGHWNRYRFSVGRQVVVSCFRTWISITVTEKNLGHVPVSYKDSIRTSPVSQLGAFLLWQSAPGSWYAAE
jgi:hypothetical protein